MELVWILNIVRVLLSDEGSGRCGTTFSSEDAFGRNTSCAQGRAVLDAGMPGSPSGCRVPEGEGIVTSRSLPLSPTSSTSLRLRPLPFCGIRSLTRGTCQVVNERNQSHIGPGPRLLAERACSLPWASLAPCARTVPPTDSPRPVFYPQQNGTHGVFL